MLRSESSLAAQLQLDALLAGIVGLQYPSDGQARGELASRTDVASVLDFVKTTFAKDASGKFTNPNMTLANASQVLQDAASKLGLRLESRTVDGRATVVAIRR